MLRKPFLWKDPMDDKKYRLWVSHDLIRLFTNVIENETQAQDFAKKYKRICENAESNIGYLCSLIKDEDIRTDALELFNVKVPEHPIHQIFGPDSTPWGSSVGFKVIEDKRWTNEGVIEYVAK